MALRNIVKDGDPILRKVCRPVEKFDEKPDDSTDYLDDVIRILRRNSGSNFGI